MSQARLVIEPRFCGPPNSGNGGYSAGLLAAELGGSGCEVTLRAPHPLAVPLRIEQNEAGERLLFDSDLLIASARIAEPDIKIPDPPSLTSAGAASEKFAGFEEHVFPGCFVCGPLRATQDGLRIFAGPIGDGRVAAIWRPDPTLLDEADRVRTEFLWAALDCPGYFAVAPQGELALLGRIAAQLHQRPKADSDIIVTGWPLERDGRKRRAGTALHDASGRLLAFALATWVTLEPNG